MKDDQSVSSNALVLHLKYIIVIFILVSSTIAGMALYNQDFAIKSLSAASLLTSIVLAVVAILITLWDVAGQKSNILSMQENLKSFNSIIEDFQEISSQNEISISELKKLIVEMNDNVISYESKFAQIEKKIEESGNEDLKEEIENIKKQRNSLFHKEGTSIGINLVEAETYVKEILYNREEVLAKELINNISRDFGVTLAIARHTLNNLENKGVISKEVRNSLSKINERNYMDIKNTYYRLN